MPTPLRGTMLTPGVSANRRLYTPELIKKAYERLSQRLKDGTRPATMLTHHDADDDSTRIVGRLTSVTMNGENLDYTAELADTPEAQTIAALVNQPDGQQFLRNVSIRGWWCSDPITKTVEGMSVTTADDMEIDGLDFTKNPGVTGAFVAPASSEATESVAPGRLITETVEARAVFSEAVNTKPYGSVRYADPGYQSDKVKRYPLDTKAHAKAAWSYINQADNQKMYTAAQLKRIRARIKSALQKFGVKVTQESDPQPLTAAATTLSECYACDGPDGTAGFSISAYNGPLTVTVSAYRGVEPADLEDVAMAAMQAACDAIHSMDPDDDGDIDTGASEEIPNDNQMETAPASETTEETALSDETAQHPTTETVEETTPVTEAATPETPDPVEEGTGETTPVTRAELAETVRAAVAAALAPQEGGSGPVTEEAAPEEPSIDEAALREQIRLEILKEAAESGVITRKGLVEKKGSGQPAKPLHEMSDDEFRSVVQENAGYFFQHNQ